MYPSSSSLVCGNWFLPSVPLSSSSEETFEFFSIKSLNTDDRKSRPSVVGEGDEEEEKDNDDGDGSGGLANGFTGAFLSKMSSEERTTM